MSASLYIAAKMVTDLISGNSYRHTIARAAIAGLTYMNALRGSGVTLSSVHGADQSGKP